jgi:antitoxin component YwqK of YwqJK toxin-antitoxin module
MIKKITTTLFLLSIFFCYSQKDTIINYLDATKRNFVSKEDAQIIRKIFKEKNCFRVLNFEVEGNMISDETFSNMKLTQEVGTHKLYYGNGQLQILRQFNEESKLDGDFQTYFKDGSKNYGGVYKNGKKDGVWEYNYANGNKMAMLFYKNGSVETYDLWNEDGTVKNEKLILNKRPQFKGGQAALVEYIRRNLSPKFRKSKFRGRLILQFTIDVDGVPKNIFIRTKNLSADDKKNILSFFEQMPAWEPGIQLNRKVKVKYTLPIRID